MDGPQRFRILEQLFHAARALPAREREAFIEERVPAEDGLRTEVRRLLAREAQESLPLDQPVACIPAEFMTSDGNEVALPTEIGRYRIRGILGRGGMGIVYEAEQDAPRRIVALKLLNAAIPSREALRRFRNEVEILGRLHHPGIARIFDAGTHDAGNGPQPYFAMELVRGVAITEHADRRRLSPRERLELIAGVCDVAQHAHEIGVVHRDLKPSNILVDDDGRPQVLDFGIARALHLDLAAATVQTAVGQLLGTVPYMSPEQAAGDATRLDARSDIYALGVVAYELLCGRRPYALEDRLMPDALRAIQEDDPTPLSAFDRTLRGDVDTIVRKALEKEPARRYQSAAAFGDDIRRYLRDLPIIARPPSHVEQLQRMVRRHRGLTAGIAIGFVLMLIGLVFSVRETLRARTAEQSAALRSDEATRSAYRASIAAATVETQTWDAIAAERRLNGVPLEQRNWEWRHLRALADGCMSLIDLGAPSRAEWLNSDGSAAKAMLGDGRVVTFDILTGAISSSQQITSPASLGVFSGDGTHAFALSEDSSRLVACALSGGPPQTLELDAKTRRIAASPDGRFVAALSGNGKLSVWDRATGEVRAIDANCYVVDVALPRSGEFIAIATNGNLRVLDGKTGALRLDLSDGEGESVAIAPDERRVAIGGPDKQVHVIDLATKEVQRFSGHSGRVVAVRWSGDGSKILSLGSEGTLRWWDATSGAPVWTRLAPQAHALAQCSSIEQGLCATRDRDGKIRMWRGASDEGRAPLQHDAYVYAVSFTSDGRRVVSAGWDGKIRVWDAMTGAAIAVIDGEDAYVSALAVSCDGRMIASGHHRGAGKPASLRLWDADTGRRLRDFSTRLGEVKTLAFNNDGTLLLAVRSHAAPTLWEVETGNKRGTLDNGDVAVNCAAWSEDGSLIATGDRGNVVALWDATTLERKAVFKGHTAHVADCCFSADGALLASASDDRTARIWNVADPLAPAKVLMGHTDGVLGIAFSPDGSRVATGSRDTTIRIWDPIAAEEITRLDGHADYIYRLAFSPDGAMLASASGDQTVRLWDSRPARELWQARVARDAALARLTPRVETWFKEVNDASEVAARIRAATDLNADEREIALQLVLQRARDEG